MPTSFTMTARDMVTQAMREIGVIASGEQPTADELSDGILRLNSMLKAWAAKGLNLWRDTQGSIDFAAGVSSAVVPDALSIGGARLVQGDTERLMTLWQADEYEAIPNKDQRGTPITYTVRQSTTGISLQLWPVPDQAYTVRFSYARITRDVVEPSDPVDVPQMFQETVWKSLAVKLTPMFGKARADPQTVQVVAADAAVLERDMLDFDRPASYQLGPDLDGYA